MHIDASYHGPVYHVISMHRLIVNNHVFANKCIRYSIARTINSSPDNITEKVHTHSLYGFSIYIKQYFLSNYAYSCDVPNCYIYQYIVYIYILYISNYIFYTSIKS